MPVQYIHALNLHTIDAPRAVLPFLFAQKLPRSLLDVGCGVGTWMKAALELGVADVLGIDGVDVRKDLLVPEKNFHLQNLTEEWSLKRHFDMALCLEVAEHLPESAAETLIGNLTASSGIIAFSAACPDQSGDHHINLQWPAYWQKLFNQQGFRCSDSVRWQIWDTKNVEPWYRQNLFVAARADHSASPEQPLPAVVHPDMLPFLWMSAKAEAFSEHIREVENGRMPFLWYLKAPLVAIVTKLLRNLH